MQRVFRLLLVLIILTGCLIVFVLSSSQPVLRITNGVTAVPLRSNKVQYPYMASLQITKDFKHSCGAVIIRDNAVLTAAHCVENMNPKELVIYAGSSDLKDIFSTGVQIRKIKSYLIHHSRRKSDMFDNDIAIVWAEKKFLLGSFVNIISLAGSDHSGESAILLGWGEGKEGAISDILMRADLTMLTHNECEKEFYSRPEQKITNSMICAIHSYKKQGVCLGDSGGPLVIQRSKKPGDVLLLGITSWSIYYQINVKQGKRIRTLTKCNPIYPSVFSSIQKLRPWILSHIDKVPN